MSFDELSERSDGDSIAGSDAETFKGVVEDIEVALTPEPRENHEHFSVSSTVDRHLDAVDAENSANLHNFIVASERLSATPRGGLSSCGSSGRSACSEVIVSVKPSLPAAPALL
jgi:hypothetical protein